MKFFAVILAVFALIGCSFALKDAVCGQQHSANGIGIIQCAAFVPSWTFDASANKCMEFVYGGCGGNDNRFLSEQACKQKCME